MVVLAMMRLSAEQRKKEMLSIGNNTAFTRLADAVSEQFNDSFHLLKVLPSGSDAQLYAVFQATGGEVNGCMIANGSHVSGNNGGMQNWSSSNCHQLHGPSHIMEPHEITSPFALRNTVPIPYYIPGTMTKSQLIAYEDECIKSLKMRINAQSFSEQGRYTVLMMELLLAGNGAEVSDRALNMIAALAVQHDFSVLVDECFTGGRTGNMLLLEQKPEAFKRVVKYVTMGKWMGAGLVLISKEEKERSTKDQDKFANRTSHNLRTLSNNLNCSIILEYWNTVRKLLGNTAERRKQVLSKFKVSEEDAWGIGIMIFAPIRRGDMKGALKFRLLPLLHNTPIDTIPYVSKRNQWNKYIISNTITQGARAWCSHLPPIAAATECGDAAEAQIISTAIIAFLRKMLESKYKADETIKKIDVNKLFPKNTDRRIYKKVAKLALQKGHLRLKRIGSARIETYIFQPTLFLPY